MKMKTLTGVAVAASVMGTLAAGADRVDAADPNTISQFFFDINVPTKLSTDSYGDPLISVRTDDGVGYAIFFYGCTDNANCTHVQFYRGYETDGQVGLDIVNELNVEHNFVKLMLDDEDDVIILMDVLTGEGGMDPIDFDALYGQLNKVVEAFETRVNWTSD